MLCSTLQRFPSSALVSLRPSLACFSSRLPTYKDPERSRKGQGWKRRKKERIERERKGPSSQSSPSFPPEAPVDSELAQSRDDEMDQGQASSRTEIHVYWDLDNLPPYDCPPEEVVPSIREQLEPYGRVKSISAFGNDDTFRYIPPSVLDIKKLGPEAYSLVRLENQRLAAGLPEEDIPQDNPFRCEMCGRKCKSAEDLSKHFKQLHEREFKKKLSHKPLAKYMFSKRQDYVKRYQQARLSAGAAPNSSIFLMQRLKNLGVQVKCVQRKPQAADLALVQAVTTSSWWRRAKTGQEGIEGNPTSLGGSLDGSSRTEDENRQGLSGSSHSSSVSRPTSEPSVALCVISNDSGFGRLLERASGMHIKTISICEFSSSAHRRTDAQVYVPWEAVAGNLQEDIGMQDGLEFAEVDFGSVEDFYEPDRPSRRRLFG